MSQSLWMTGEAERLFTHFKRMGYLMKSGAVKIGLIAIVSCFFLACKDEVPLKEVQLRPVKTLEVSHAQSLDRDRVFTGQAKSVQETNLSFNVSARVLNVFAAVGDRLDKGQLIADIDPSTYKAELDRASAALAQARAEQRNAKANYQRTRQLYENKNASLTDLDGARAAADSTGAQVRSALELRGLAKLNLSYTKLKSPDNCMLASIDIEKGENVTAASPVAMLTCGEAWEVEISVSESLISAFKPGLKGSVIFDAIPRSKFSGRVSEVGIAATSGGATYPVTLALEESHPNLRSGLASEVTVKLTSNIEKSAGYRFFIPSNAVSKDQNGHFVFVVEKLENDQVAMVKRRGVTVGDLTELGMAITSGLSDGEHIVVAGVSSVRDGLHVLINQF